MARQNDDPNFLRINVWLWLTAARRRQRIITVILLAAGAAFVITGSTHEKGDMSIRPWMILFWSTTVLSGLYLAYTSNRIQKIHCPRCANPFFANPKDTRSNICSACGYALEVVDGGDETAGLNRMITPPMVAYARARGWNVEGPFRVSGILHGLPIAIVHVADRARTQVEAQARDTTPSVLNALKSALETRLPAARVETTEGRIRIEVQGSDPVAIDEAVDELAAACAPEASPYR